MADAQLQVHLKLEEEKFELREADKQKEATTKKDEELKQDAEEKNNQIQAQLESVRRPEALRQQSYRVLNDEGTVVAGGNEPIEPLAIEAFKEQAISEPAPLPAIKADHQQIEKLSIDADRIDMALQERERQEHEKALLEAEVRRGMQNGEQRVVEEPQPAEKTQIQSGYMESLAFDQKRNEEIIQDRASQEREKALEEIKRRLEHEAELKKELNKNRGLGRG